MLDAEAIGADDVLAALRGELDRVEPPDGEIVTLVYWSDFREPDGRPVEGFVAGYQAASMPFSPGENWVRLRLADGLAVPFWPRFPQHETTRLLVAFASAQHFTFALSPATGSQPAASGQLLPPTA